MEKISIAQAAKEMGKSQQFVRIGLRRGILPFGVAVQMSTRWTYYINPNEFNKYMKGND